MIFFSLNQVCSFCLVLLFGIICGVFNAILGVLLLKNHQNNIFNFIFKLIISFIFVLFLIFSLNKFYFGIFSIVIILGFCLGYIWITTTLKNLLDFLEIKFYYIYKYKKLTDDLTAYTCLKPFNEHYTIPQFSVYVLSYDI